ncbi:conserved Plasmodium protein, unknown function [Plasmodium vinckei vinckei]|uniref:Uncharacterized protein n=1 Tax=Plasmodium vinckei vinckei TaxID=54757 RepID=A0A449BR01_PLAVN|nr:conserved Plasmodium protein, unknown function [Plasmodium vinckei vinckei]VEV55897.1 conserved Plasmodium protein, unknown function [Plasmodium vinckei vinckei]
MKRRQKNCIGLSNCSFDQFKKGVEFLRETDAILDDDIFIILKRVCSFFFFCFKNDDFEYLLKCFDKGNKERNKSITNSSKSWGDNNNTYSKNNDLDLKNDEIYWDYKFSKGDFIIIKNINRLLLNKLVDNYVGYSWLCLIVSEYMNNLDLFTNNLEDNEKKENDDEKNKIWFKYQIYKNFKQIEELNKINKIEYNDIKNNPEKYSEEEINNRKTHYVNYLHCYYGNLFSSSCYDKKNRDNLSISYTNPNISNSYNDSVNNNTDNFYLDDPEDRFDWIMNSDSDDYYELVKSNSKSEKTHLYNNYYKTSFDYEENKLENENVNNTLYSNKMYNNEEKNKKRKLSGNTINQNKQNEGAGNFEMYQNKNYSNEKEGGNGYYMCSNENAITERGMHNENDEMNEFSDGNPGLDQSINYSENFMQPHQEYSEKKYIRKYESKERIEKEDDVSDEEGEYSDGGESYDDGGSDEDEGSEIYHSRESDDSGNDHDDESLHYLYKALCDYLSTKYETNKLQKYMDEYRDTHSWKPPPFYWKILKNKYVAKEVLKLYEDRHLDPFLSCLYEDFVNRYYFELKGSNNNNSSNSNGYGNNSNNSSGNNDSNSITTYTSNFNVFTLRISEEICKFLSLKEPEEEEEVLNICKNICISENSYIYTQLILEYIYRNNNDNSMRRLSQYLCLYIIYNDINIHNICNNYFHNVIENEVSISYLIFKINNLHNYTSLYNTFKNIYMTRNKGFMNINNTEIVNLHNNILQVLRIFNGNKLLLFDSTYLMDNNNSGYKSGRKRPAINQSPNRNKDDDDSSEIYSHSVSVFDYNSNFSNKNRSNLEDENNRNRFGSESEISGEEVGSSEMSSSARMSGEVSDSEMDKEEINYDGRASSVNMSGFTSQYGDENTEFNGSSVSKGRESKMASDFSSWKNGNTAVSSLVDSEDLRMGRIDDINNNMIDERMNHEIPRLNKLKSDVSEFLLPSASQFGNRDYMHNKEFLRINIYAEKIPLIHLRDIFFLNNIINIYATNNGLFNNNMYKIYGRVLIFLTTYSPYEYVYNHYYSTFFKGKKNSFKKYSTSYFNIYDDTISIIDGDENSETDEDGSTSYNTDSESTKIPSNYGKRIKMREKEDPYDEKEKKSKRKFKEFSEIKNDQEPKKHKLENSDAKEVSQPDKEKEVSQPDKEKEVNQPDKEKEVSQTNKEKEVSQPDKEKEVNQTDNNKEVSQTDKDKEVNQTDNNKEVNQTDNNKEVSQTDNNKEMSQTDKEREVSQTDKENEISQPDKNKELVLKISNDNNTQIVDENNISKQNTTENIYNKNNDSIKEDNIKPKLNNEENENEKKTSYENSVVKTGITESMLKDKNSCIISNDLFELRTEVMSCDEVKSHIFKNVKSKKKLKVNKMNKKKKHYFYKLFYKFRLTYNNFIKFVQTEIFHIYNIMHSSTYSDSTKDKLLLGKINSNLSASIIYKYVYNNIYKHINLNQVNLIYTKFIILKHIVDKYPQKRFVTLYFFKELYIFIIEKEKTLQEFSELRENIILFFVYMIRYENMFFYVINVIKKMIYLLDKSLIRLFIVKTLTYCAPPYNFKFCKYILNFIYLVLKKEGIYYKNEFKKVINKFLDDVEQLDAMYQSSKTKELINLSNYIKEQMAQSEREI